ncbi:MAG: (Fe-S)-binding protein [Anaerolineae bacterium]|nr:(Fe-S)-binding protein [Anaerolineae bacterium]
MTSLPERLSPQGQPVALFVTCIIDLIYPQMGLAVVDVLEHIGIPVDFPQAQTCCGQPAFNSGYQAEARTAARQFLRAFDGAAVIVCPSGSCAAMVRHEYPRLFPDEPEWAARAERAASRTWEFSEYLVDGLGLVDLQLRLPAPRTFAFHDACHGLRLLGLRQAARALIAHMENATLVEMTESDVCCGFGGLFSLKMPEVSSAMLQTKLNHINATPAEVILTGDASCLAQMNGGLARQGHPKRVRHWVEVLAEGLPKDKYDGHSIEQFHPAGTPGYPGCRAGGCRGAGHAHRPHQAPRRAL